MKFQRFEFSLRFSNFHIFCFCQILAVIVGKALATVKTVHVIFTLTTVFRKISAIVRFGQHAAIPLWIKNRCAWKNGQFVS